MESGALWQLGAALLSAGTVYGAIRMDLRGIHETIKASAARAEKLEDRFNQHIEKGLTHGNT